MFRITCNLQYSSPWQWSKILWTNCSNWISADQISLTQNPKLQALITIQSTFLQSYLQQHIVSMTTHINWWRKRKAGPDKASISTLTTPTIWLRHLWRSLWYSAWMAQFNIKMFMTSWLNNRIMPNDIIVSLEKILWKIRT